MGRAREKEQGDGMNREKSERCVFRSLEGNSMCAANEWSTGVNHGRLQHERKAHGLRSHGDSSA